MLGTISPYVNIFYDICRIIISIYSELKMIFTAKQIAQYINGTVEGDENTAIHTFSKIEEGVPGAITFLANAKYEHYLYTTEASIVLVNDDFKPSGKYNATLIRVPNAYESIAKLLTLYEQSKKQRTGVSPQAYIAPTATVGENCYIGPFVCIEDNVTIGNNTKIHANCVICENSHVGDDCILYPNVSVYHDCKIGNRAILHAGVVIGADGFGFAPTPDGYEKIPQIGIVTIEDDVEIGANTCIDRSTMGSTIIRKGVKLDNMVQIGHNVVIDENTVMSAQCGVAGSTKIGKWCMFGGQVGIAGHATIADKTHSGAKAGIAGSIVRSGETVIGVPAIDARKFSRSNAVFRNLPEMYKDLYNMKKELEELKQQIKK